MPEYIMPIFIAILFALWVRVFYVFFRDRYGRIKTVRAEVVHKYVLDRAQKIYGSLAKNAGYYVVFSAEGKRLALRVSELTYNGYNLHERGTLKYRGRRVIDFQ